MSHQYTKDASNPKTTSYKCSYCKSNNGTFSNWQLSSSKSERYFLPGMAVSLEHCPACSPMFRNIKPKMYQMFQSVESTQDTTQ